jgi:hypothetical protein
MYVIDASSARGLAWVPDSGLEIRMLILPLAEKAMAINADLM